MSTPIPHLEAWPRAKAMIVGMRYTDNMNKKTRIAAKDSMMVPM
ncbi:putative membrane immunity protein [Escherichia phage PGN829.1]|uniref:Putative membrane immunity protein n=1 Tax=Escherichia phage PGN829.1 TaxID=2315696 RepID=A0A385IHV0_9CAUD|nr:putative membrane immunity protein [Escherichia phage PGN829.1]AXY82543.1 putative membrane immunity protein [Escherichia phage PGN829.1]